MFIHVKFNNAIRQGHTNVMIWTVDSDVVVSLLAIKFFIANHNGLLQCIFKTLMPGQGNLLIGFGTSRHYVQAHSYLSVCRSFGSRSRWLNYALSGSDLTASFVGHGTSRCFKAWNNNPQFDYTFRELSPRNVYSTCNIT